MSPPDDAQLSVILDRFDREWAKGGVPPEINSYLPADGATSGVPRGEVLIELVMIDLERRWRSGEGELPTIAATERALPQKPILEDYVGRLPELGSLADLPTQLIVQEYRVRKQWGDRPSHVEYRRRFPSQAGELARALASIDDELRRKVVRPTNQRPSDNEPTPTVDHTPSLGAKSEFIGPYKILQPIAEGGMGSVFMAEQQKPVKRRVALKIIKSDVPSKDVLARFEAERQALAMMDHQNIAKVLDAGVTAEGLPYFAMELVKGIPITKYCDQNKLTPKERLELFVQVCRAIQHAHQKGIIHRDIKPSNVLVTLYDGKPVAKVIDFGLAKALQTQLQLTERTMFTQFGQVVGTLEYMSPEQAEMNTLDVDTRTDVYSLGVMLYELLTGSTPIGRERLKSQAFDRILQLIREEEVPRPSTRLSESGDAITGISEQRKTDPKKLSLMLKGDLDWIAMKALEKNRTRRYDGASALADDVERYLRDEPIVARPPSLGYQIRKTVRKHKAAVTFATSVVALLVAGVVGIGTMWLRASYAEANAKAEAAKARNALREAEKAKVDALQAKEDADAERDRALAAESKAKKSGTVAIQQSQFALETLERVLQRASRFQIGDDKGRQEDQNARSKLITSALERLTEVADQFLTQIDSDASVLSSADEFGDLLLRLAPLFEQEEFDTAVKTAARLFERSLAVRIKLVEVNPRDAQALDQLVRTHERLADVARASKHKVTEAQAEAAIAHLRNALLVRSQVAQADIAHTAAHWVLIRCHDKLADCLQKMQRSNEAIREYEAAFSRCETLAAAIGDDDATRRQLLARCESVAGILRQVGQVEEALRHYRLALSLREQSPQADTPAIIQATEQLADVLRVAMKTEEAIPYYRRALERRRTLLGSQELTGLIAAQFRLGELLVKVNKVDEGIAEFRQAFDTASGSAAQNPQDTAIQVRFIECADKLAEVLRAQKSTSEAIDYFLIGSKVCEALLRNRPDDAELRGKLINRFDSVRSSVSYSYNENIPKDTGTKVLECLRAELRCWRSAARQHEQSSGYSAEEQLDAVFNAILGTATSAARDPALGQFKLVQRFLADELADYQQRAQESPGDGLIQYGLARQYRLLGELSSFDGYDPEAAAAYFDAEIAVLEKLVESGSWQPSRQAGLFVRLGEWRLKAGDHAKALEHFRSELRIRQQRERDASMGGARPRYIELLDVAAAHRQIAKTLNASGDQPGATEHNRLAVGALNDLATIAKPETDLSWVSPVNIDDLIGAGNQLWDAGEVANAQRCYELTAQTCWKMSSGNGLKLAAECSAAYAERLEKAGRVDEARRQITSTIEMSEKWLAEQKNPNEYVREELCGPYKVVGDLAFRQARYDEAITLYEKGLAYTMLNGGTAGCCRWDFYAALLKSHVAHGDDLSGFLKSLHAARPGDRTRSEVALILARSGNWEAVAQLIHDWESALGDDSAAKEFVGWGTLPLAVCCAELFRIQADRALAKSQDATNGTEPDDQYLNLAITSFRKGLALAATEKDPRVKDSYLDSISSQLDLLITPHSCAVSEPLIRDHVAALDKHRPQNVAKLERPRSLLAMALLGQKKYGEAESLLLQSFRLLVAAKTDNRADEYDRHWTLQRTLLTIIRLYTEMGQPDEVEKWRLVAEKQFREWFDDRSWLGYSPREWYVQNLIDLYATWNKPDESAIWKKRL